MKIRSKITDRITLINKSLDQLKDDREVNSDRISKRKRISQSLLFSDDSECHKIEKKISDCKKYQRHLYGKFGRKWWDIQTPTNTDPLTIRPTVVSQYINDKNVCQSLWCPHCRKHLTKVYELKIRKRLGERLLPNSYSNRDFHHISGVLGLCSVDSNEVQKLIDDDEKVWRRIRYRVRTTIDPKFVPFIESVYEFELVNWRFLRNSVGSDFKKKQIQQLKEQQKFKGDLFLFVHFHSITNLSKEQINDVFGEEYFVGSKPLIKTNPKCGLYVQKFHTDQTIEKNIEKLCSYPFKDPHRFKHSFRGSDYLNGEYYEFEELSQLIKVYQNVQKRSWRSLFRTVEHPKSVEYLKYQRWFPSDHQMWGQYIEFIDGEKILKTDRIQLDTVWIVDKKGDVYTEGWDPNKYFYRFGLSYDLTQLHRTKIGMEQIGVGGDEDYRLIWVPKFKEIKPPSTVTIPIRLEQFYYPKEFNLLKKEQFFGGENRWGYYSRKDPPTLEKIKINRIDGLPMEVEFGIDDPLFVQRYETVIRLNETERIMYLNHQIKKDRDQRKSDRRRKELSDRDFEEREVGFDRLIDRMKSEGLIDPNYQH